MQIQLLYECMPASSKMHLVRLCIRIINWFYSLLVWKAYNHFCEFHCSIIVILAIAIGNRWVCRIHMYHVQINVDCVWNIVRVENVCMNILRTWIYCCFRSISFHFVPIRRFLFVNIFLNIKRTFASTFFIIVRFFHFTICFHNFCG